VLTPLRKTLRRDGKNTPIYSCWLTWN
jgi:hypothetical protein